MAMMSETPGTARPGVFPYYPYAGAPLAYGTGPVGFPSQIVMRERPTIDKLCLSKLDVPRLLLFREKFIRLLQVLQHRRCIGYL